MEADFLDRKVSVIWRDEHGVDVTLANDDDLRYAITQQREAFLRLIILAAADDPISTDEWVQVNPRSPLEAEAADLIDEFESLVDGDADEKATIHGVIPLNNASTSARHPLEPAAVGTAERALYDEMVQAAHDATELGPEAVKEMNERCERRAACARGAAENAEVEVQRMSKPEMATGLVGVLIGLGAAALSGAAFAAMACSRRCRCRHRDALLRDEDRLTDLRPNVDPLV